MHRPGMMMQLIQPIERHNLGSEGSLSLPEDFREWVPEDVLICLTLEAIHNVAERHPYPAPCPRSQTGASSQLLCTLLTYSYAIGLLATRDIQLQSASDKILSYLCRKDAPDSSALRTFRRTHPQKLSLCLATLFELAAHWRAANSQAASGRYSQPTSTPHRQITTNALDPAFLEEAQARVKRAIQADSMDLDD